MEEQQFMADVAEEQHGQRTLLRKVSGWRGDGGCLNHAWGEECPAPNTSFCALGCGSPAS